MTVDHVTKDGEVKCVWFDANHMLQSATLKSDILESSRISELLDVLTDFVFSFNLVFDSDWEMTKGCLEDPEYLIKGTFINPLVDDESNNWANRGLLLANWRNLLECMERSGVLEEFPF